MADLSALLFASQLNGLWLTLIKIHINLHLNHCHLVLSLSCSASPEQPSTSVAGIQAPTAKRNRGVMKMIHFRLQSNSIRLERGAIIMAWYFFGMSWSCSPEHILIWYRRSTTRIWQDIDHWVKDRPCSSMPLCHEAVESPIWLRTAHLGSLFYPKQWKDDEYTKNGPIIIDIAFFQQRTCRKTSVPWEVPA